MSTSISKSVSGPDEGGRDNVVFRLRGIWLFLLIDFSFIVACLFVVIVGIVKDFDEMIPPYCEVWDVLPTISTAMSCCIPQRYVWRFLATITIGPKLIVPFMYYNHYMAYNIVTYRNCYRLLAGAICVLHIAETIFLHLMTTVMSGDNPWLHEKYFYGFVGAAQFHMVLMLCIIPWSRSIGGWKNQDWKSYKYKLILAFVNLASIILLHYFLNRYIRYCQPGMYTAFAFLEYVTVATNIGFHATAIYEYGDGEVIFSEVPINKLLVKIQKSQ